MPEPSLHPAIAVPTARAHKAGKTFSMPRSGACLFIGGCLTVATAAFGSRYPFDPVPVLVHDPKLAAAGDYRLELAHSSITVRLSHMGLSLYTLRFNSFSGHYRYDPMRPTASRIEVAIDPASIDTGNPNFNAIIATTYFEVARYSAITFTSAAIQAHGNHGTVVGVLEMHGVRRPIVLNVTYNGFYGAEKPERMGFSATANLKRSDFGVDPSVPAEGDDVTIMVETEFRKA